MPAVNCGSTIRTTGISAGSVGQVKSESTPAPIENNTSRFSKSLKSSGGGAHKSAQLISAGFPTFGQIRTSNAGKISANVSAHC